MDLTSGVEFNREWGGSTLAVFLDVLKAYDRVSAASVLAYILAVSWTTWTARPFS